MASVIWMNGHACTGAEWPQSRRSIVRPNDIGVVHPLSGRADFKFAHLRERLKCCGWSPRKGLQLPIIFIPRALRS